MLENLKRTIRNHFNNMKLQHEPSKAVLAAWLAMCAVKVESLGVIDVPESMTLEETEEILKNVSEKGIDGYTAELIFQLQERNNEK